MKRKVIVLTVLLFVVFSINAQVIVTDTSAFQHVTHTMRVDKTYCSGMHTLEALFPYMQSNHYQVVENQTVFSGGVVRENTEGGNRYIGYSLHTPQLLPLGDIFDLGMSFDVATININVNFNAIDTIYPYDTTSVEYLENTGSVATCILPHHPHIDSVSNIIWSQSTDIIDYARRCYEYTASHLNYINANTGLHSLQQIIDDGGGDCGNFSSYYISLLRSRNIPARHVVTVIGLNDYHIWSEFYLQNYGWIPVDPTFKNGDPSGDYFGHKNSPHYIATLGAELTNYKFGESSEPMQIELMQLYYFLWWAYDPCTSSDFSFNIQRLPTATVKCLVLDTNMGVVYGGGRYLIDSLVTLTATSNSGYHFDHWSTGDTVNPYTFTITSDTVITAYFEGDEPPLFTITTGVNDSIMGYVTGDGEYYEGSADTLTAIPFSGYSFTQWHDGNTDNPRIITVTEDATYIAEFQPVNGIDGVDSDGFHIYVQKEHLVFCGAEGETIQIFDMMGRSVDNHALSNGVYVVKVGNRITQKVVIIH